MYCIDWNWVLLLILKGGLGKGVDNVLIICIGVFWVKGCILCNCWVWVIKIRKFIMYIDK